MKDGFLERFSVFAQKIGAQIHLRSLRDSFATIMPLYILAGLATLLNNVFFTPDGFLASIFLAGTIEKWRLWGNLITNGTLNISAILVAVALAYHLSSNRRVKNLIAPIIVAVSCLIVLLPALDSVVVPGTKDTLMVSNVILFSKIGTMGMFAGIFVGLFATELFLKLSKNKRLQINIGQGVPPAVGQSFNIMIPAFIVIGFFSFVSFILQAFLDTNCITLISTLIQEPLKAINTSLPGYILIYSFGNFFFTMGIHQAVINGPLLDPILLSNISENMIAYSQGAPIPNIINYSFQSVYGLTGGTGNTIGLLIAIFLFSKYKVYRDIGKLALAPGLFNINEPVIFGIPIVFNISLIIPFVLSPAICLIIAYFATAWGFISPCVVLIPWTTPPILSAFLATGGDWRAVVLQILLISGTALFYLPFLKMSERIVEAEMEGKEIGK
jgi:PTS system cellobiose-specific IIC component